MSVILYVGILACVILGATLRLHRYAWAIAHADWRTVRSLTRMLIIQVTWRRLARELDLVTRDRRPVAMFDPNQSGHTRRSVRTPLLFATADQYGVRLSMRLTPGVSLVEVQRAAPYLADAWRSVRVAVDQQKPGWLTVRAVRLDPLTLPSQVSAVPAALPSLESVPIGMDEYAEQVSLRLKGISGIGVYGLPGAGKTSLIYGLITRMASMENVHFVVLDGKSDMPSEGDYGELENRILYLGGDDLKEANRVLKILTEHRKDRARRIRSELGTGDIWNAGFSTSWPLIVVIIDEAHTYFSKVADNGDKTLKERNAKAAMNIMLVEDLVKKGRAVGIITVIATQKGTGDAVPTQIRDVCAVSLCFAVKTIESAIAALGEDIRDHPDVSPVLLQDPIYIGVAVMHVLGRPGFTRVRMPYVPEDVARQAVNESALCWPTTRATLDVALPSLKAIEA